LTIKPDEGGGVGVGEGVIVGLGVGVGKIVGIGVAVGVGVTVGFGLGLGLAFDVVTKEEVMIAIITNITISNLIFSVSLRKVPFVIYLSLTR